MIRKVRLERNLTQEELGKLIGVQRAQISKLENNTTNVTMETILKVFGKEFLPDNKIIKQLTKNI
jgi:transcriptional regulator with XRE-family HTH domain